MVRSSRAKAPADDWPAQGEAAQQLGMSDTMLRKARTAPDSRLPAEYYHQDGRGWRYDVAAIRTDPKLRCPVCGTLALGPSGYCEPHRGKANRGKRVADGTRAPTAHYDIDEAERKRRAEAMREASRQRWQDQEQRDALLASRREQHAERRRTIEQVKAEYGLVETADMVQLTRTAVTAGRSEATVNEHVRQGRLAAVDDVPLPRLAGRGPNLYHPDAAEEYLGWLKDHPDGRLRRFDDPRFRGAWHCAVHHDSSLYGRLAKVISEQEGKTVGRRRALSPEEETKIRELADKGRSQRAIARIVGVSRGQVRRLLDA